MANLRLYEPVGWNQIVNVPVTLNGNAACIDWDGAYFWTIDISISPLDARLVAVDLDKRAGSANVVYSVDITSILNSSTLGITGFCYIGADKFILSQYGKITNGQQVTFFENARMINKDGKRLQNVSIGDAVYTVGDMTFDGVRLVYSQVQLTMGRLNFYDLDARKVVSTHETTGTRIGKTGLAWAGPHLYYSYGNRATSGTMDSRQQLYEMTNLNISHSGMCFTGADWLQRELYGSNVDNSDVDRADYVAFFT